MRYFFARLDKKHKSLGSFEKFSKIFKHFLRKLRKIHYFSIFSNNLTNHPLIFHAFGGKLKLLGNFEKILKFFDNIIRKIEFLTIFGNAVAKNRAFGNNLISLQQFFFHFGAGTFSVFPPGGAYDTRASSEW